MKNNFLQTLGLVCLVVFMGSSISSCSVEDGVDGINGVDGLNGSDGADGQDGVDGADGQDGADGADGADAIGLEEFANYGSIDLRVQGVRPDSVAFDHETELEFISPELYYNNFEDEDPDLDFYFLRLADAPNTELINSVGIAFYVSDHGLPSEEFDFDIEFSDLAIFSEDLKYIALSGYFSGTPLTNSNNNNNSSDRLANNTNASNTFTISDYSFDDTTNNLKFSFSMDIPAANNQTGNDINIGGTIDVIVFEKIGTSSKARYIIKRQSVN